MSLSRALAPALLTLLVLPLLVTGLGAGDRQAAPAPASALDMVLAQYATEGPSVIRQAFPDEAAYRLLRGELFQRTRQWRESWSPVGTTFLLDLTIWTFEREWPDALVLLRTAGDIVSRREAPVGAVEAQDAYEIRFHRVALAVLGSYRQLGETDRYLENLRLRVSPAPSETGEARLVDPRVGLARALALENRTRPGSPLMADADLPSLLARPGNSPLRQALERAVMAFESAARVPPVADEAHVRGAFVLHRLGRHQAALDTLALPSVAGSRDNVVTYWRRLVAGRVLEALGRPDDAAAEYEAALTPAVVQTPAVALASLRQRQGRAEDAQRWASAARQAGLAPDPWWQYWTADLRFVPGWLEELRRVRP